MIAGIPVVDLLVLAHREVVLARHASPASALPEPLGDDDFRRNLHPAAGEGGAANRVP
jgi:hypothetical protein